MAEAIERIGPFRIEKRLGEGGMGQVFLGVHMTTGLQAAVKILSSHASEEPELRKRFRREMASAASMDHPHVIKVYEAGQDGNQLYLAMEYLPFPDLDDVLKALGPMAPLRALGHGRAIASALRALHRAELIHRDLKPANLIVAEGERIVVVDFGLVHDEKVTKMTATGAFMGTPRYLPPEAFAGKPALPAWDVWQLGLILYEMITAKPAWDTTDLHMLMAKVINQDVPSLEAYRPGLPSVLDALIARCTAKSPEARPCSVSGELEAFFDEAIQVVEAGKSSSRARLGRRGSAMGSGSTERGGSEGGLAAAGGTAPAMTAPPKGSLLERQSRSSPSLSGARPATLIGSSPRLDGSDVLGPSDTLQGLRARSRRWLLVSVVLLALFAIGGGLWLQFRPEVYSVAQLEIHQGLGCLAVTWQSGKAYRSRIEAGCDEGAVTLFEGLCDEAGRHLVELRPLTPGKTYRLSILFPDGRRSLPRPVKVEELRLRPLAARREGDELTLEWESNLPTSCELHWTLDDGSTASSQATTESRRHELTLLIPESRITKLEVELRSRTGGKSREDLGDLTARLCHRIARSITVDASAVVLGIGFDEDVISVSSARLTGHENETREETRRERRKKMAAIVRQTLEVRGIFDGLNRLAPFMPLALDEPFFPASERELLRGNLAQLRLIYEFCHRRNLPGDPVPTLSWGRYEVRHGQWRDSQLATVEIWPGRGKRIEVFRPLSKVIDKIEWRPTLRTLPRASRPELGIESETPPASGAFFVTINGHGPILATGRAMARAGKCWVGFPDGWLVPGMNRITIQIKDLPGTFSGSGIWIKALRLAVADS